MTNRKGKEIQFTIDHLDRFGQGVFKDPETNQITFIPDCLPGEEGRATLTKSKGKVQFAKLSELTKESPARKKPDCDFFHKCRGCQYWMTDYSHESEFKQGAFNRNLRKSFPNLENLHVDWLSAEQRTGYRNRIQLHYDKKQKQLGYRDNSNNIINITSCIVASEKINHFLQNMLQNQSWLKFLRKNDPPRGHFEIYESPGADEVLFSINEDYAFGGFSQVNVPANELMLEYIHQLIEKHHILAKGDLVLDLFGGSGNLSKAFTNQRALVIDGIKSHSGLEEHQIFHEINLYSERALEKISDLVISPVKLLILDPPRSGLRNLNQYLEQLKPEYVLYISCQYDSLLRDLKSSQNLIQDFMQFALIDLFPATHHVEALCLIKTHFK